MGRSRIIIAIFFISFLFSCDHENKESLEPIENECTVYVHRVNTIQKATAVVQEYKGIETDIIFDETKKRFYVKHDVQDDTTALFLDELLESLKQYPDTKIWLDFKNLDNVSVDLALNHLVELDEKYELKRRVFIESWNYRRLKFASELGFKTSCWTPRLNQDNDTLKVVKEMNSILQKHQFNAISNDFSMFEIFNKYFPEYHHHYWFENGSNEQVLKKACSVPSTKVVLIDL